MNLHFQISATNGKFFNACILLQMYNKGNKLYFILLKDVLKAVIRLNSLFQGDRYKGVLFWFTKTNCTPQCIGRST